MLNGIDVIYWINLDRSQDRRNSMQEIFNDPAFNGIKNTRFSAIDYKSNDILDYFRIEGNDYRNNKAEYACFLSHLETIKQFSNSNLPDESVALILEDYITLEYKPYWKKSIKQVIDNAPSDWQIIMLNYTFLGGIEFPDLSTFNEYEKRNITDRRLFCAAAYLIKKSSAKQFMNKIYIDGKYELDMTIEMHHADEYLFTALTTYVYKYPYFTYKTDDSLLHPKDVDNHIKSKMHIKNSLYNVTEGFEGFVQKSHWNYNDIIITSLFLFIFINYKNIMSIYKNISKWMKKRK